MALLRASIIRRVSVDRSWTPLDSRQTLNRLFTSADLPHTIPSRTTLALWTSATRIISSIPSGSRITGWTSAGITIIRNTISLAWKGIAAEIAGSRACWTHTWGRIHYASTITITCIRACPHAGTGTGSRIPTHPSDAKITPSIACVCGICISS